MKYEIGTKVIVPINGNRGTVVRVERNGIIIVAWEQDALFVGGRTIRVSADTVEIEA
jgi:hypothetical protein